MTEPLDRNDDRLRQLRTALVSDILDRRGLRNQVMEPGVTYRSGPEVFFGRAATMLATDQVLIDDQPYHNQIAATDALRPGDVIVAAAQTPARCAFWGELFSAAAIARGARGIVVDGLVRDTRKLNQLPFSVLAAGTRPTDSTARLTVAAYGIPVRCFGVVVSPDDYVFGDTDGVVVIPDGVADSVVDEALAKAVMENQLRDDVTAGMTLADAYAKHGVL